MNTKEKNCDICTNQAICKEVIKTVFDELMKELDKDQAKTLTKMFSPLNQKDQIDVLTRMLKSREKVLSETIQAISNEILGLEYHKIDIN